MGPRMMDYLSYSTKVYQLVQRFSLVLVLLYDRVYRKLQSTMGFRWGRDVQHFSCNLGLVQVSREVQPMCRERVTTIHQNQRLTNASRYAVTSTPRGAAVMSSAAFSTSIVPGCNQGHPATAHSQETRAGVCKILCPQLPNANTA